MKKAGSLLAAIAMSLALVGCQGGLGKVSTFAPSQSSIFVAQDSSIASALVETYQADYYDQEELKQYLEQAVTEYNQASGAAVNTEGGSKLPVVLQSCVLKDQQAVAIFEYATADDFIQFTNQTNDTANQLEALAVSTVAEGVSPDFAFISTKDQTKAQANQVTKKGEWHQVNLTGTATVQTEGKILFVTEGVSLLDEFTAVTSAEKSCIIFE